MLKSLGEVLVRAGSRAPSPERERPRSRPTSSLAPASQFSGRAKSILEHRYARRSPLVAGSVQLLGLAEIRSAVGSAWDAIADKAYAVVERVLETHLSNADVCARQDDETYVICFAELSKEEAQARVRAIVGAAKDALLEEVPEASQIVLRQRVTTIEQVEKLNDGRSLLEAVAASLEAVRQEHDEITEQQRRILLEHAKLIFVPVWLPNKESVALYRCTLDDATSKTTLRNLSRLTDPEVLQQAVCDLDYVILGHGIQTLHRVLKEADTAVLLIPVHYHSLNERTHREAYLSLCRKIPRAYSKYIMFELYGVPQGISSSRLSELIQVVRQDCFSVVLLVSEEFAEANPTFGTLGLYGLSADLGTLTEHACEGIVKRARASGLRTFGRGAKTLGMVAAAIKVGFDFIDGNAVAPTTNEPRGLYRWRPPGLPE